MLHSLIVPNRVRHKSGSVDGVPSHKVDDNAFVVRETATWFAEHNNEKLRLPVVSTSGTSAADAIVIDSDEDIDAVSFLPCTETPREPPINHGVSLNQDVVDYSDSDIELLSVVHSGNKVENDPEASYHSPLPPARELSPEGNGEVTLGVTARLKGQLSLREHHRSRGEKNFPMKLLPLRAARARRN